MFGNAGGQPCRGAAAERHQNAVVRLTARDGLTSDHVLRSKKQVSVFLVRIRKESCDAAVNGDIRMALCQSEIMKADVTRPITMDCCGYAMNLSKVGYHEGRKNRFSGFWGRVGHFASLKAT